jgi:dUTP pyrophosphatase
MSTIKFKLDDGANLPQRGSPKAAGLDIECNHTFIIEPKSRVLVSTGVSLADCPEDIYLRVAPRSKLANKFGIDVLAGVVDSDYRGEICVILYNTGVQAIKFMKGKRVAQLIPEAIVLCEVQEAKAVTKTLRAQAGIKDKELRL